MKFTRTRFSKISKLFSSKKRKIVTLSLMAILAIVIGGSSYYASNENFSRESNLRPTSSSSDVDLNSLLSDESDTKTVKSKKPHTREQTADEKPTLGSTPSGCVGCETPNPGFSIVTTGTSIILSPNSNSATYTASASDGRKLSWSGPESNVATVFGLTNSTLDGKSFSYYIRAESGAKPGTYSMTITGLDAKTETVVRKNITVKVLSQPSFSLSSKALEEDITSNSVSVSVQINRYSGHTASISGSGSLKCPSKATIYSPVATVSENYIYLTFTSSSISAGSTCTLTVNVEDTLGVSDTRSYNIKL